MAVNEVLRQELLEMRVHDQEMRNAIGTKYKEGQPLSQADSDWWESVDTGHTRRMQEIIREHGWPGKSLVGEEAEFAAWLLVQHADRVLDFQKQCLESVMNFSAVMSLDGCHLLSACSPG